MKELGANKFASILHERGMDFKYGGFTIFAPADDILNDQVLILESKGHNETTIFDIALFHVSAETISEAITDKDHCGKSLLMLNEELHVNQESSTTTCENGSVYQVGPGNDNIMPKVVGEPIHACDSIVYVIEDAIMLPTLPVVNLPPTAAPKKTKAPTRQDPIPEPTEASEEEEDDDEDKEEQGEVTPPEGDSAALFASRGSLAFTAFAALMVAYL